MTSISRRGFLAGAAIAVVSSGCASSRTASRRAAPSTTKAPAPEGPLTTAPVETPPIRPAKAGPPLVVRSGSPFSPGLALTFDDGYCKSCIGTLVAALEVSGVHATLSPNGTYSTAWDPYADRIKALVANGQLGLCNHTFSHHNPLAMSEQALARELDHNEQWIETTFGATSRPFYRPPYGYRNHATDDVAGYLGYTNVVLWSGTLCDATPETPGQIIAQMEQYCAPGVIMLGHANHPTTGEIFDQLIDIVHQRHLQTLTLAELLGTSGVSGSGV
jgi:peptidoglycan-N-acetylglucosamine deacetylase